MSSLEDAMKRVEECRTELANAEARHDRHVEAARIEMSHICHWSLELETAKDNLFFMQLGDKTGYKWEAKTEYKVGS